MSRKKMYIYKNGTYITPEMAGLEEAIQADKYIVSKIVVEYSPSDDMLMVTFPPKIMPICAYDNTMNCMIYFNYLEQVIEDADGTSLGTLTYQDNGVTIFYDSLREDDYSGYVDITYVYYDGYEDSTEFPNWSKVFNPAPAGTKLYKHEVEFIDNDEYTYRVRFLATRTNEVPMNDMITYLNDNDYSLLNSEYEDSMGFLTYPIILIANGYVNSIQQAQGGSSPTLREKQIKSPLTKVSYTISEL